MEVVIIDYGMGNLRSVKNATEALGHTANISDNPEDLKTAEKIILPGVGAFPDGMKNLFDMGFVSIMNKEIIEKKKPFLGICLGMQLIAMRGTEVRECKGLGWIEGLVQRIVPKDHSTRIPHIGWNDVSVSGQSKMFFGVQTPIFYFVHSFALIPKDKSMISSYCNHGEEFASSIVKGNIWATQFHPEKSQKSGLRVLKNFLEQEDIHA